MHCHGTDLRDLWRPGGGESKMTWRLLGNLIRHLPPESATKTALRNEMGDAEIDQAARASDPSEGQWSRTDMLLAVLIDEVRELSYATVRVQTGKGRRPEPLPRPGVRPKSRRKRPKMSAAQREMMFARINGARIEGEVTGRVVEAARPSPGPARPSPE